MKCIYKYDIGDIVDDLECIDIIHPIKGSRKSTTYVMKCRVCGRIKNMVGATIADHRGTTHKACGQFLKTKNPKFYRHWQQMRTRTTNPNVCWKHYGGRGITSDEFKYFIDFYDVMFESYMRACEIYGEKNVSLERKDVDGSYTKENCEWIHINKQKSNWRKTVYFEIEFPDHHKEIHRNVNEFAKEHQLSVPCIRDLINGRLKTYKGYKAKRLDRKSVTTNENNEFVLREEECNSLSS